MILLKMLVFLIVVYFISGFVKDWPIATVALSAIMIIGIIIIGQEASGPVINLARAHSFITLIVIAPVWVLLFLISISWCKTPQDGILMNAAIWVIVIFVILGFSPTSIIGNSAQVILSLCCIKSIAEDD